MSDPSPVSSFSTHPIPTHTKRYGRPFNMTTLLGKRMHTLGMRVGDVASASGMSERKLSNFLADRRTPSAHDMYFLADTLHCDVEDIAEPGWPGYLG